jgi:hypothetical protein
MGRRSIAVRSALALIGLALIAGCDTNNNILVPPTSSAGTGAIYGIVYTFAAVAPGITITTDPPTQTVVSSADGSFRINGVPAPVVYRVKASGVGFTPDSQLVAVRDGDVAGASFFVRPTDTLRVLHTRTVALGTVGIAVEDSTAYLATEAALEIRDLHSATFGQLIGRLPIFSSYWRALTLAGSYVYYSTYTSDLAVVDVSNPAAPVRVGTVAVPQAHDAEVDGNVLAVAGDDSVLFFSLANPAAPARLGAVATQQDGLGQGCYGIALDRTRKIAIVSSFNNGIELVGYADPAAPVYLAQVSSFFNPWDADVDPVLARAYVAGDDGVQILDYTNPLNAEIIGEYAPGGNGGKDVKAFGNYLVFASSFNGLYTLDATNPAQMRVKQRLILGSPSGLAATPEGPYLAAGNQLAALGLPLVPVPPVRVGAWGPRPARISAPRSHPLRNARMMIARRAP